MKTKQLVRHRLTNSTFDHGCGRPHTSDTASKTQLTTKHRKTKTVDAKPPRHKTNPPLCHLALTTLTIATTTRTDRLGKKERTFETETSVANGSTPSYASLADTLTELSFATVIKANHWSAVQSAATTFLALFTGAQQCVAVKNSASARIREAANDLHTPQATPALLAWASLPVST